MKSLKGLSHPELLSVHIMNCRRSLSLENVVGAPHLVEVTINRCRAVSNIAALSSLKDLCELRLFDIKEPIPSVHFIEKMPTLLGFRCVGSKIADGDLGPLTRLKWIGIDDKRHYSLTEQQLHSIVRERGGSALVRPGDYARHQRDIRNRRHSVAKRVGFKLLPSLR